jgi:hypothetical protein
MMELRAARYSGCTVRRHRVIDMTITDTGRRALEG